MKNNALRIKGIYKRIHASTQAETTPFYMNYLQKV